jgi:hypothetical protein
MARIYPTSFGKMDQLRANVMNGPTNIAAEPELYEETKSHAPEHILCTSN